MTVFELAVDSCLCERQFRRKVRQKFGISPRTLNENVRLLKAIELMSVNSDKTLKMIACECGYSVYKTFKQAFFRRVGISPSFALIEKDFQKYIQLINNKTNK